MPRDSRDPRVRLGQIFDPGSWSVSDAEDGSSGVLTGRGRIAEVPAVGFCTDVRTIGGTLGIDGCRRIVSAIETAVRERCPVVGLWDSNGARIDEGVTALDGVGRVFEAMTRASGKVPQISVAVGPVAGGAAYGPALTDVVIMTQADRRSGVAHVTAKDEPGAYRHARRIIGLLGAQGEFDVDAVRCGQDLRSMLPSDTRQAFDVKPVVRTIMDADANGLGIFEELQAKRAPNILTGLGRLGRRTVGVVANNSIYHGGLLDSAAAGKAAKFVRMCDSFGIPLMVVADIAPDAVGPESDSAVWQRSKLVHAFANAVVPRVTLVPRKAYGEGYVAMNSRSLGATAVFAWAGAEIALMPARPLVRTLHQDKLAAVPVAERNGLFTRLVEEHRLMEGGVARAMALGMVDGVIEPWETGLRIASALAAVPAVAGLCGNIPL